MSETREAFEHVLADTENHRPVPLAWFRNPPEPGAEVNVGGVPGIADKVEVWIATVVRVGPGATVWLWCSQWPQPRMSVRLVGVR